MPTNRARRSEARTAPLGELAADQIGLLVVGARDGLPDLLLTGMVAGDGERHELLQRHAVLGIDVEELSDTAARRRRCFTTAGVDEEPRGDLLVAERPCRAAP